MKRAIAIAAGVIAFVACTSAQSGGLSVDPAFAETRVMVLRCGGLYGQYEVKFNPASYGTGFGQCAFGRCVPKHGSRAVGDLDHGIEFRIDKDPSWKMRIDWREQAYSVYFITQECDGKAEIVDAGFCRECRELPQLPAPVSVRQSADTTNAPRAEIKVVAPETREKAAVITDEADDPDYVQPAPGHRNLIQHPFKPDDQVAPPPRRRWLGQGRRMALAPAPAGTFAEAVISIRATASDSSTRSRRYRTPPSTWRAAAEMFMQASANHS